MAQEALVGTSSASPYILFVYKGRTTQILRKILILTKYLWIQSYWLQVRRFWALSLGNAFLGVCSAFVYYMFGCVYITLECDIPKCNHLLLFKKHPTHTMQWYALVNRQIVMISKLLCNTSRGTFTFAHESETTRSVHSRTNFAVVAPRSTMCVRRRALLARSAQVSCADACRICRVRLRQKSLHRQTT